MSRKFQGKSFEDLCLHTSCGCVIWLGHEHKASGLPIWKGWFSASHYALELAYGVAATDSLIVRGRTCGHKLCIEPSHLITKELPWNRR